MKDTNNNETSLSSRRSLFLLAVLSPAQDLSCLFICHLFVVMTIGARDERETRFRFCSSFHEVSRAKPNHLRSPQPCDMQIIIRLLRSDRFNRLDFGHKDFSVDD
jgi:hypothetical protein